MNISFVSIIPANPERHIMKIEINLTLQLSPIKKFKSLKENKVVENEVKNRSDKKTKFGFLTADVLKSEKITMGAETTNHPVEFGFEIFC